MAAACTKSNKFFGVPFPQLLNKAVAALNEIYVMAKSIRNNNLLISQRRGGGGEGEEVDEGEVDAEIEKRGRREREVEMVGLDDAEEEKKKRKTKTSFPYSFGLVFFKGSGFSWRLETKFSSKVLKWSENVGLLIRWCFNHVEILVIDEFS